ncbi:hypothetical protein PV327_005185 [Microctonus hyperodae]|uniref:7tm 6 domain containing protein n=1 Tax=Microctonus hyperodae TaxID=165561 RepID=A0AA39G147_MICHY|nr:hypothetical protein PV327_005185 [Microctonus hyperodae]
MFIVCVKIFGVFRWRRQFLIICRGFESPEFELRTTDEIAIQKRYDNTIRWRKQILKISRSFEMSGLEPRTPDELAIQKQYDKAIRIFCLAYTIMCDVASSGTTFGRLFEIRRLNILPYRIYLPYNYSKPFLYRFTISLQFITVFIGSNIDAGFDTLFYGVMLQIISKINILKHRLKVTVTTLVEIYDKKPCNIQDYNEIEEKFFANWIKSHNAIISLYDQIEFAFSEVIFIQYSFSALSLCITVYLISQLEVFTTEFMGNFAYLIAATCEIFVFCIAANQVTFEVRNTLYIHQL